MTAEADLPWAHHAAPGFGRCKTTIWPAWANQWMACGGPVFDDGYCMPYRHPQPKEPDMSSPQLGPDDPGGQGEAVAAPAARDACASCDHSRYRHNPDQPDGHGSTICHRAGCACGGVFVEMATSTRMARFVEAAQELSRAMNDMQEAWKVAGSAAWKLHHAMDKAGLLPEEGKPEPVQATFDGRQAAGLEPIPSPDLVAEAFGIPVDLFIGRRPVPGDYDTIPYAPGRGPIRYPHLPAAPEPVDMQTASVIPPYTDHEHGPGCVRHGCPNSAAVDARAGSPWPKVCPCGSYADEAGRCISKRGVHNALLGQPDPGDPNCRTCRVAAQACVAHGGPGLCDGCDTVTEVEATDDGRALGCRNCLPAMNKTADQP